MWDRRARAVEIHDGDTQTYVLDQGFGDTKELKVRLLGVFAPELKEPGGTETKVFVQEWFSRYLGQWPVIVTTVRVNEHERMTFGRYVAVVNSFDYSRSLNADVQSFVVAHGYGGGVGG